MKKAMFGLLLVVAFIANLIIPIHAQARGVDHSKIRKQVKGYPVTLYIGELEFNGKLSKGYLTDQEIEDIIKEVLRQMGKTELDIGEAEALVEKVASDEKLSPEKMKNVRDNLMKLAGVPEVFGDLIDYIQGKSEKTAEQIAQDWAADQVKEKVAEKMAESVGLGDIVDPLSKFLDLITICEEQYGKDKEKWKNRAEAANAARMLYEFYSKVNSRIDSIAAQRGKNWAINIDFATDHRYFTYWNVFPGNLQTWTVDMFLTGDSTGDSPVGQYKGVVNIQVDNEMSKFDPQFAPIMYPPGQDKYASTYIGRTFSKEDFSYNLQWVPFGIISEVKEFIDFSNLKDELQMIFDHTITTQYSGSRIHVYYDDSSKRIVEESWLSDGTYCGKMDRGSADSGDVWGYWTGQPKWLVIRSKN